MLEILEEKILKFTDINQDISDIEGYNPFTNSFIYTLDNLPQPSEQVKILYFNKNKSDSIYNLSKKIFKSDDKNRTR